MRTRALSLHTINQVLCLRRNLRRGQEEQLGRRAPQTSLLGGGGKKGIGSVQL